MSCVTWEPKSTMRILSCMGAVLWGARGSGSSSASCRERAGRLLIAMENHGGTPNCSLPPCGVGESHMDLRGVLRRHARWILRTTPEALGESDGEIQESFPAVARSAGGQCPAQAAGRFGHCAGRVAERGGQYVLALKENQAP